jgi:hypothetical protein
MRLGFLLALLFLMGGCEDDDFGRDLGNHDMTVDAGTD